MSYTMNVNNLTFGKHLLHFISLFEAIKNEYKSNLLYPWHDIAYGTRVHIR